MLSTLNLDDKRLDRVFEILGQLLQRLGMQTTLLASDRSGSQQVAADIYPGIGNDPVRQRIVVRLGPVCDRHRDCERPETRTQPRCPGRLLNPDRVLTRVLAPAVIRFRCREHEFLVVLI